MSDGPGGFCSECGSAMPDGARFCAKCGTATPVDEADSSEEIGSGSSRSAEDQPPKRRKKWLMLAAGVVVVLVAGVVIASTLLSRDSSPSDYLLIGEPRRDDSGQYDLYLVQAGAEATNDERIARDVRPGFVQVYSEVSLNESHSERLVALPSGDYAVSYEDEDTSVIAIGSPSDWESANRTFESSDYVNVSYETGTDALVIVEYRDSGGGRCYVFGPGADADRLARSGSQCFISLSLDAVFETEESSDGEIDVTVSDLEGNELSELTGLQDSDMGLTENLLFYVDEAGSGFELVAVEWRSGAEVTRSRSYDSIEILDSAGDVVLFVGDDGEGSLDLMIADGVGEVRELTEAFEMEALLSNDGRWVFYATADVEGEWDLFAESLASDPGAAIDLNVSGTEISGLKLSSLALADDGEPFLVVQVAEEEEVEVYGGSPTSGVVSLFSGAYGFFDAGHSGDRVYLGGSDSYAGSGDEPLYVYDVSAARLIEVDERWENAYWADASENGGALVVAFDDDEEVLYYVPAGEDPEIVELDLVDGISSAVFDPDRETVWYSVEERGDYEVRQVTLSDDPEVEIVYEDGELLGTAWEAGLSVVTRRSSGAAAFIDPVAKSCRADGLEIIEYGSTKTVSAGFVSGTHDTCVSLHEETVFEVRALANNDTDLTISVEAEFELGYNDDFDGSANPYVNLGSLPPGTYRVRVGAFSSASWNAEYDLVTGPLGG